MNRKILFGLFFNIIETIVIFMTGLIFNLEPSFIIVLMVTFFLSRLLYGQPKHYNKWYRCFIWSLLTFTSVYALTDLHIIATILLTIFAGFIATGRADINDLYQWKGKNTKYEDIEEYIKYNSMNDNLIQFEKKLKEQDNLLFLLYKYRFKENLTFAEISEKLDLENPRIVEKLNTIAFSIRIYCGI